jgi:1-acyl-sn-glycerol-3-phosphate acyltransferase
VIRTLWAAVMSTLFTIYHGTVILFHARTNSKHRDRICRDEPRTWAQHLCWAAGVEVVIEGAENLPPGQASVLVANHTGWFDVLSIAAYLPREYRFVAKKELAKIPFFGGSWVACGHIALDRADLPKAISTLENAAGQVREDRPTVIMFPEGTRSATGELLPFKKGAFVLAIQLGAPVIPAAIIGSREVMKKGSWMIRSGVIRIRIGAPIPVEGLVHGDRDALSNSARAAVSSLQAEGPLSGPWLPVIGKGQGRPASPPSATDG